MLIQFYPHSLRLITQNDHALLSGKLAYDYRVRLPYELSLAIALHDLGWVEADSQPLWDEENRVPFSFVDYPHSLRVALYRQGIEQVSRIHPYAGYLVSLHYQSFLEVRDREFGAVEEERRTRLKKRISDFSKKESERSLKVLKFFDHFSLWLCLAPPGVLSHSLPSWLTPELLEDPFTGEKYKLQFVTPREGMIEPYPFLSPSVDLTIPFREIPFPLSSEEEFRELFFRAPIQWITMTLLPGRR
jgi:hypothetical protein